MKKLFKLNRILVITNLILFITIYLGMIFLMVLGAFQIVMSIIILFNFSILSKTTKVLFSTYLLFTSIELILLTLILNDYINISRDYLPLFLFIIPSLLALLHFYTTYLIKQDENTTRQHYSL